MVAFFPSYDYLAFVLDIWKKPIPIDKGQSKSTFGLIEQKKKILYEPRKTESSNMNMNIDTENLLQEYKITVESNNGKGALLLSVVGGKLSEGINFSDRLGRGILIIGLPFPNIRSAIWQSKIEYVEEKALKQSSTTGGGESKAKEEGRNFYENACMRAVNQSIGRAIRHQNDYAAIIMIDKRYESSRIQGKLPTWIRQSFGSIMTSSSKDISEGLFRFFAGKGS